jgi:hypothetical protein
MDELLYSLGVTTFIVGILCAFTFTTIGINYILVSKESNIFQKGIYMITWTYLSIVVGFLHTILFPLFTVFLISADAKLEFKYIKKYLNNANSAMHNLNTSNEEIKEEETNKDETNVDETNVDETNVEETNVEETNVDECECIKNDCECNVNDCDTNQCCKLISNNLNEDENKSATKIVEESKSSLEILKDEITQIQEKSDGELIERLQTVD